MSKKLLLVLFGALLMNLGAQAQPTAASAPPVLKASQVTESALIDALALEPPEGASGATRGFRPAAKGGAPVKAGPGKASLLITFGTDSAELSTESQAALEVVAKALQSDALAGFMFRVEGHADARGDADRNLKLSQARAESVVNMLSSRFGILPERLEAIGKGSSEPMNLSKVDAPENRRVTIVTRR
ncbi:OmpA family protein [Pelomonas sp. SE-A7]|uniref:OmpA family protein n=1 Tax=Pelomonas sp. SE-A7 TaxID=3054953 RepID=UPI00259CBBBC|nr:OmpA family protein [Pelomonas sp. SE-A7]MDM4764734.1 OmpA family protein [Pelomonas sp. SE-A7]